MKIKVAKDYSSQWKEEDVTLDQLQEYVDKGYAIKINCWIIRWLFKIGKYESWT